MEPTGNLVDRSKQYANVDGVGELSIGVTCLGYALLGWMQMRSPEHSAWHGMLTLFVYLGRCVQSSITEPARLSSASPSPARDTSSTASATRSGFR